jgi:hypothetical protein
MTTQNRIKTVLTLAAVAILALAIGQAQAITVDVPNGDFETMYKPGSTTVTASLGNGEWFQANSTNQGLNCALQQGGIADYSDGTTGTAVDLPGWTFIVGGSDVMMGGAWGGVGGGMGLSVFTGWGGTTQITSANPLNAPASGSGYTLSADVYWNGRPIYLDLTVDGVVLPPTTASDPPGVNAWAVISRTYASSIPAGELKILFGTIDGPGETGTRATLDNITLNVAKVDPTLPDVDAGIDMISWSGQAVTMDPNVVNNDTEPQGELSYLWTAEPNGIGDPNLDVAITGADTENASVTITKTALTGDATVVTMTLAVTLEGEDPVTDSMTIDVYDDACVAALDLGLTTIDTTDLDENCITAFPDFAVMAATWLDDYALTEAVAK